MKDFKEKDIEKGITRMIAEIYLLEFVFPKTYEKCWSEANYNESNLSTEFFTDFNAITLFNERKKESFFQGNMGHNVINPYTTFWYISHQYIWFDFHIYDKDKNVLASCSIPPVHARKIHSLYRDSPGNYDKAKKNFYEKVVLLYLDTQEVLGINSTTSDYDETYTDEDNFRDGFDGKIDAWNEWNQ